MPQELLDKEKSEMVNNAKMERSTKSFNFAAYHGLETVSTWTIENNLHDIRMMISFSNMNKCVNISFTSAIQFYGHACCKSP